MPVAGHGHGPAVRHCLIFVHDVGAGGRRIGIPSIIFEGHRLSQRHNTMAECVDNPRQTLLTKISIRF